MHAGVPRFPIAMKIEADNLSARAGGWRTSTGVLLRQPMAATINFTPALARHACLVHMHVYPPPNQLLFVL